MGEPKDKEAPRPFDEFHIRNCILYEFRSGSNAIQTKKNICSVYPKAVKLRKCQRLYEKYKKGELHLPENPDAGKRRVTPTVANSLLKIGDENVMKKDGFEDEEEDDEEEEEEDVEEEEEIKIRKRRRNYTKRKNIPCLTKSSRNKEKTFEDPDEASSSVQLTVDGPKQSCGPKRKKHLKRLKQEIIEIKDDDELEMKKEKTE